MMTGEPIPDLMLAPPPDAPIAVVPMQAESDEALIRIWLHGRAPATQRAYAADVHAFLAGAGRPLRAVTVGDVQGFEDALAALAPASRARKLAAVKSLLAFAQRVGYVTFNVGAPVRLPPVKTTLAERILSEADVHRLLALELDPRNAALLRLLYAAGLRISEACALAWRDLQPRDDGGQVSVFGKGGKTRVVLLSAATWATLAPLRGDAAPEAPVFRSHKGGHLDPSQVHRIVKAAALRAGLPATISAHWLRHAHASHALDRGAPLHLVQGHLRPRLRGDHGALPARPTQRQQLPVPRRVVSPS